MENNPKAMLRGITHSTYRGNHLTTYATGGFKDHSHFTREIKGRRSIISRARNKNIICDKKDGHVTALNKSNQSGIISGYNDRFRHAQVYHFDLKFASYPGVFVYVVWLSRGCALGEENGKFDAKRLAEFAFKMAAWPSALAAK